MLKIRNCSLFDDSMIGTLRSFSSCSYASVTSSKMLPPARDSTSRDRKESSVSTIYQLNGSKDLRRVDQKYPAITKRPARDFLKIWNKSHAFNNFFHHIGGPHGLCEAIREVTSIVMKVNDNGVVNQIITIWGFVSF